MDSYTFFTDPARRASPESVSSSYLVLGNIYLEGSTFSAAKSIVEIDRFRPPPSINV